MPIQRKGSYCDKIPASDNLLSIEGFATSPNLEVLSPDM